MRELSFEVLSGTWVDFLGVNSCVVTHPGGVSTLISYHARGSPLVMALLWVVSVPGSPSSGEDTSEVKIPPSGATLMALKPPFLFPLLLFCMVEARSLSGNVFTRRCPSRATPLSGDASLGRCLSRAMPQRGNDSLGRCLSEAMTRAVILLTSLPWVP